MTPSNTIRRPPAFKGHDDERTAPDRRFGPGSRRPRPPWVPEGRRRWRGRSRYRPDQFRRRRAGTAVVREGQAAAHRLVFVSDPLHLQNTAESGKRWRFGHRSCSFFSRCSIFDRRAGGGRTSAAGRRQPARQRRLDVRADEGEVRRDHDARLSAVHQRHVPGRDPHGSLLGTLW